ncbi:MAG: hypothetical protein ACXWUR_04165 [Allosphingosinicella sp.]
MSHASLIAIVAGLSVTAALATEPPAPPSPKETRICRGATRTVGSHIRTPRRCKTAEQWQVDDEAKSQLPLSLQVTEGQNTGAVRPPR